MHKSVAIIGAGPAGLMAAEKLSESEFSVTIYERMPSAARKFLMAGRGGLNITHSEPLPSFLKRYGAAGSILTPFIRDFSPSDLCAWCEGLGQEVFVGSSGRVFPRSMKASPLLRAWLSRLERKNVKIQYRYEWRGWDENSLLFSREDGSTIKVTADATLLGLGGASWPRLGSDGSWAKILEAQNIPVAPFRPSNCGFTVPWSPVFQQKYSGQPVKPVVLTGGNVSVQGEIMITETGVEGGAIYALSAHLRSEIEKQGSVTLALDLRPDISLEELRNRLKKPRGRISISNYLRKTGGLSPVAIGLVQEVLRQKKGAELAQLIKSLPLNLTGTAGLERAISTAGGVSWDAVNDDLMLKMKPGVFVAGEMLDWEAPTGGYLLQATFSTAVRASRGIIAFLNADSRI